MSQTIILGIDGGATHTRILVADTDGHLLARVDTRPSKRIQITVNQLALQQAIQDVVVKAGHTLADVVAFVGGFAGFETPDDEQRLEELTALPGLNCSRTFMNDAVVAHMGAFCGGPGVVAIAGTGTNVYAVTDGGDCIRNRNFAHYARASAYHVASSCMAHLLAGDASAEDADLTAAVLDYWHVDDVAALRRLGLSGDLGRNPDLPALVGGMAPCVTQAALEGSPLARAACDDAAGALALGIRLVGACFITPNVPVVLSGSVARSPYMQQAVRQYLEPKFLVMDPAFPPAAGALLIGLSAVHGGLSAAVLGTLRDSLMKFDRQ